MIFFKRRCEERNIKEPERLSELALTFCEQIFNNMHSYLQEIANKLIDASYKDEWGLYGRELSSIAVSYTHLWHWFQRPPCFCRSTGFRGDSTAREYRRACS